MTTCEKIEGLIAQSLYEDLHTDDRQALDDHLAECGACREAMADARLVRDAIPSDRPELGVDLTPVLRKRLERRPQLIPFAWGRMLPAAAALALVSSGVLYMIFAQAPVAVAPNVAVGPVLGAGDDAQPAALVAALAQSERGEYAAAYAMLNDNLGSDVGASAASDAHQLLANWAFEELHWYPEARHHYETLRVSHNATFLAARANRDRLELLEEARARDTAYASLHALDAARRRGSFEDFERFVAQQPGTFAASVAANDMALLIARTDPDAPQSPTQAGAMELALARCTDPITVAQLKVELGHLYRAEAGGEGRALALYKEVAGSEYTVLAELARHSMVSAPRPR